MKSQSLISSDEFKSRRDKLLAYIETLSANAKLVLYSGEEKNFSNDVYYPFRVDSDFYYLTGFTQPGAVLVLEPKAQEAVRIYIEEASELDIIWTGPKTTAAELREFSAISHIHSIGDFDNSENSSSDELHDKAIKFIHSLRAIKSKAEQEIMRQSNRIAVQAHSMIPQVITPGIYEYELEATLNNVFRASGANGWAYPAIVASGSNACILHYIENNSQIQAGEVVLIDAGAEYKYYSSDITRVYAVDGDYSSEQQIFIDIVYEAQQAAIAELKPGNPAHNCYEAATKILGAGLKAQGLITDASDLDQIKKYFMHGIGHSLGIDTHDPGFESKKDTFIPGVVMTIEPGLYIPEKNLGIRIEDNLLITDDAFENFTDF